jgi:hypothetical protein
LLADLLQKAQGGAANVLVGMLEVVPDGVADEDHLLLELSVCVVLGTDFPEEVEELGVLYMRICKYVFLVKRAMPTFFKRLSLDGRTNWMTCMRRADWG